MTIIFIIFILVSVVMWVTLFKFIQKVAYNKSSIVEPSLLNGNNLVIELSSSGLQRLTSLSKESKHSYVDIATKGIALFALDLESKKNNNRLAVVDSRGNIVKEISGL